MIRSYLPVCVILFALMLFSAVVKFFKGRWTLLVAASHSLYGIFSAVVGIFAIFRDSVCYEADDNRILPFGFWVSSLNRYLETSSLSIAA